MFAAVDALVARTQTLTLGRTQVRFATKKASGSRTNKNDSAGRRLGPKAYEGHFVKPGQIIMRQRGTTIHPGENTDIGRDHTIFAIEPGYVRFYYDPFHPLRKYVGVALDQDTKLPLPHFAPRMRRFGYEEITDPEEAIKEEQHMSRKEYLQQPELELARLERELHVTAKHNEFDTTIDQFLNQAPQGNIRALLVDRLVNIYQLTQVGQLLEEAQLQTTFNYIYDLRLQVKRGEILQAYADSARQHYTANVADATNDRIALDARGALCVYRTPEQVSHEQKQILQTLQQEHTGKVITSEAKSAILGLIETPGVFGLSEQIELRQQFLPPVLPVSVPGTVKEEFDPKKPGKDVTVVRVFDPQSKVVKVYGRTKDAFVAQEE